MEPKNGNRSGRVTFDERGCAIWEWRTEGDQYSRDIETVRLKALQDDGLSLVTTDQHAVPQFGFNPYDTAGEQRSANRGRSLDDMRALDARIKAMRRANKDKTTP